MTPLPKCRPSGPRDAEILIVGEAPGREEDGKTPFLGQSGDELSRMLAESNIDRERCRLTNVVPYRPPGNDIELWLHDSKKKAQELGLHFERNGMYYNELVAEGLKELNEEIQTLKPKIIVPLGNTALWAVTGNYGITKWRGSYLPRGPFWVIPTFHPANILRQWHWRALALNDLRRVSAAARDGVVVPRWNFVVQPKYEAAAGLLSYLKTKADLSTHGLPLVVDLETRRGHIACIGFAWNKLDAMCIPLIDDTKDDKHYWTASEERDLVALMRTLMLHPNVRIIGQNFLYDLQYLSKFWGCAPRVHFDTMVAQHVCWPGLPKGLDFLSSMYCEFHQYWKDDGKNFNATKSPEEQLRWWTYNCRDTVHTFECWEALSDLLRQLDRVKPFNFQMHELYPVVFGLMLRGVRVDTSLRGVLAGDVQSHIAERQTLINFFAKRPLNPRSPKQLQELFYQEFKQKVVRKRDTGKPTTDAEALDTLASREPLLRRLVGAINETRSLGSANNIIMASLDSDQRMRCSYNIAGAETFRFSSSESAFDTGTNLQNITSGGKSEYTGLALPNLRRLLAPDPGKTIVETDLDRADLQVVVWEAESDELKFALKTGLDLHLYNARVLFNLPYSDNDLRDPEKLKWLQSKYNVQRQVAKVFCHATNYGGKSRTVAAACGLLIHEADKMQNLWFGAHPGIKKWHGRTQDSLNTTRSVANKFGYVRFYFDRIEECLPEALAWVPQSTVALVINQIMVNLNRHCRPDVELLLQVHDSTVFQIPTHILYPTLRRVHSHTRILVPYPDPLYIPVSYKASPKSWGDCKGLTLEEIGINPAN